MLTGQVLRLSRRVGNAFSVIIRLQHRRRLGNLLASPKRPASVIMAALMTDFYTSKILFFSWTAGLGGGLGVP